MTVSLNTALIRTVWAAMILGRCVTELKMKQGRLIKKEMSWYSLITSRTMVCGSGLSREQTVMKHFCETIWFV